MERKSLKTFKNKQVNEGWVTWTLNEYWILDCQSLEMSHSPDSVLMGCYRAVGSKRKITQVFTDTVMNAEIDTFSMLTFSVWS